MRILLLSGSNGLPRKTPEVTRYEDLWTTLLRNDGHLVFQISIGSGVTSNELYRQVEYGVCFYPDLVIVQGGFVDCAPRFASKFEQELLKRIPIIGRRLFKILNKPAVRRWRKIAYVSPERYRYNVRGTVKAFKDAPVYYIGIFNITDEYEKLLPGSKELVKYYNNILKEESNYIGLEDFDPKGLMSDHQHYNVYGHQLIYEKIKKIIENQPKI